MFCNSDKRNCSYTSVIVTCFILLQLSELVCDTSLVYKHLNEFITAYCFFSMSLLKPMRETERSDKTLVSQLYSKNRIMS